MEPATPSPTSEPAAWEPPDWLLPEAFKVGAEWWAKMEQLRTWPETFVDAFAFGYVAGYERRGRRRKVDGSEAEPALPPPKLPPAEGPSD